MTNQQADRAQRVTGKRRLIYPKCSMISVTFLLSMLALGTTHRNCCDAFTASSTKVSHRGALFRYHLPQQHTESQPTTPWRSSTSITPSVSLELFRRPSSTTHGDSRTPSKSFRLFTKRRQLQRSQQTSSLLRFLLCRIRRCMVVGVVAATLSLSAASFQPLPAHASEATMATTPGTIVNRKTSSSSYLSRVVQEYVLDHMFDDDTYDPIESNYREAHDDATRGRYPQALREITASVLGKTDETSDALSAQDKKGSAFGSLLTSSIAALQKKGLSESAAIVVLASLFVIAGPVTFLFVGMIFGGISKRNMNRVMKKRYGETYTVDATIKKEEDVEAPDDDEDDEDDEDDDDEDDDDDDE